MSLSYGNASVGCTHLAACVRWRPSLILQQETSAVLGESAACVDGSASSITAKLCDALVDPTTLLRNEVKVMSMSLLAAQKRFALCTQAQNK